MNLSEEQRDAAAHLAMEIAPMLSGLDTIVVIAALSKLVEIGYMQLNDEELPFRGPLVN